MDGSEDGYSRLLVTCPVTSVTLVSKLQIANYFLLTANPVMVLEIVGLAVSTCNWTGDQQSIVVAFIHDCTLVPSGYNIQLMTLMVRQIFICNWEFELQYSCVSY